MASSALAADPAVLEIDATVVLAEPALALALPEPRHRHRPGAVPLVAARGEALLHDAGREGLRALCVTKAVTTDRFPLVHTAIPPPMQYPVKAGARGFVRGPLLEAPPPKLQVGFQASSAAVLDH